MYYPMHVYLINMRKIEVIEDNVTQTDEVDVIYEKRVTPFG